MVNPSTEKSYRETEIFVGAKVTVFGRVFELFEADEYALKYMEADDDEFEMCNVQVIVEKIHQFILTGGWNAHDLFTAFDRDGNGWISREEFKEALKEMKLDVTEQEIVTLMRRFDLDNDGHVSYEELVAML